MKTGGRLIKHARYSWMLLTEGHLHRRLFGQMLRRIYDLPCRAGSTPMRLQNVGRRRRVGAVSEKSVTRQKAGLVSRQKNEPSEPPISLGPALVANWLCWLCGGAGEAYHA